MPVVRGDRAAAEAVAASRAKESSMALNAMTLGCNE